MRLLVTGGRNFDNRLIVFGVLLTFHEHCPITVLGHGDAPGLDRTAAEWAELVGVPVLAYRANWALHGPHAGPVRNAQMLRDFKPDMLMAFPGGTGTAHMVTLARKAQVPVAMIEIPSDLTPRIG